jgi:hypothetical protein
MNNRNLSFSNIEHFIIRVGIIILLIIVFLKLFKIELASF